MNDVGVVFAEASRGNQPENRYTGWLTVTDTNGCLLYCTPGADQISTFFRSSAKPFQSMPLVLSDLHQELTLPELAIACGSHSGSKIHVEAVQAILAKAGLNQEALGCGPHPPLDEVAQQEVIRSGQQPQKIHNNCSGKHAGMLLYCVRDGLDIKTYLEPEHPLQQAILAHLKNWTGLEAIETAIDGCGAPVFYLPLVAMSQLYARLGIETVAAPIVHAMTRHPVMIGGEGRVDTVLMQLTQGRLLTKVGADGVIAVSKIGKGEGLTVKMADGSNEIRNLYIVWALWKLGWLSEEEYFSEALAPFRQTERLNTQGKIVGEHTFFLPFDEPKGTH